MPQLPRAIPDVTVKGEWSQTFSGADFLLKQDLEIGLPVFDTTTGLKYLLNSSTVDSGGNFQVAPNIFTTLCTFRSS